MISLPISFLVNFLPLWVVFNCYFYNFYTALQVKAKHWKIWLGAGAFCLFDLLPVFLIGDFRFEKISYILIILFIVSPIIYKKTDASFFKVVSVCILLTGMHLSFTILSDVVSMGCAKILGISIDNLTLNSYLLITLSAYTVQFIMCLLLNLFLRSQRGHWVIMHLFQTPGVSLITFVSSVLLTGILIAYFFNYYDFILTKADLTIFLFAIYVVFGGIFGLSLAILSYIRLYQDKLKFTEAMLVQQQSYNQVLEDIQQDIRHFQHDYKNILSSFYLQLKEGKIE